MQWTVTGVWWRPVRATLPGVKTGACRSTGINFARTSRTGAPESEILTRLPDVELNGPPLGPLRLPNNLNISIPGVQGETIVLAMDLEGVAISAGSACTTGRTEPSHVLLAMGMSDERARSSIRMTVGRGTTRPMVTAVAERLARCVVRVRELGG